MSYVIKTAKSVDEAVSQALKELNISREDAKIEILDEGQKGFLGLIGSKDATVKVTSTKDETESILNEIFSENIESEESQQAVQNDELKIENNDISINNEDDFTNNLETEEIVEVNKIDAEENYENYKSEEITSEDSEKDYDEDEVILETAREFISKLLETLELENIVEMELVSDTLNVNINGDESRLGILIGKRGVTLDSIQYILNLLVNKKSSRYIRVSLDSSGYREKRKHTLEELAEKMARKVVKSGRPIKLEPMNSYERKIIHTKLQDFDGVLTHSEGRDPFRKVVIQKEREY
ncbi:Jag N-terminal domain-containing protein [Peptoniphilus sp. MSJ-1]|uniref:RNA-binding protein KhpB n=1 Tax=Peptoniphilus ovalis TaxID=2841503 RepID=A0ABS6FE54_9FIRM|nr:RNA-binding cell elongation regulator Jag/EloR [Peptoniphilus ovalis]MBU5668465.1 Jag N-terminal domain-containing protein [Peptoniphilus ovalis]